MTSPICTVNGSATSNGVNVAKNSTVTIAIADTAGVKAWSLKCLATDDHQSASNVTSALTINGVTKVATFTSPNVTDGSALIFESKVNGGLDINGRVDESLTTRFGVYVVTDNGNLRVGAFDETVEGNASFGWLAKFNAGIRAAAAGALTPSLSGTLPIVVNNSNPVAPVISINAATTSLPGSMSAADKTKLNASTELPTVSTIVMRDSGGRINAASVSATVWFSEATPMVIDMDGVSTPFFTFSDNPKIEAGYDINAPGFVSDAYKLATQQNLSRSIPLNWSACKVGGVHSWDIDDTSNIVCAVADAFGNLVIECDFVHGCHITGITIRNRGPAGGTLPQYAPTFSLYRKLLSTGVNSLVGTVNATLDGTYRGTSRDTLIDLSAGAGHIVGASLYRYFLVITPEYGSDALAGHIVYNAKVDCFLPATFAIGMD